MRFSECRVPSVRVSAARRLEIEETLRSSNLVLKGYYLRAGDYPGGLRAFFAEICRRGAAGGVEASPGDFSIIRRVKDLEWELLCDCSRLIYKISDQWSKSLDQSLSVEDVDMVAVEAFLRAACGYVGGCRFSTYLVHCVKRGVMRMREDADNPLGFPLEVVRRRREVRRLMGQGRTLDSAIVESGVPGGMVNSLVMSMGAMENLGELEIASWDSNRDIELDYGDVLLALEGLDLDPLEREVLDEFFRSGGDLNLSVLAGRLVNPGTGRPYTRMNMSLVWKRLKGKMLRAFRKAA